MTKTISLILLFDFIAHLSPAQVNQFPFPMENAQWFTAMNSCNELSDFLFYTCQDTIVDGHTYTLLVKRYGDTFIPKPHGWLRREGEKVYYRVDMDSTENLLYNFALLAGDTARLVRRVQKIAGPSILKDLYFKVKTLDSVLVNGDWRKRWTFVCTDPLFCDDIWIEGIGSNFGPVDRIYCVENGNNIVHLNCLWLNLALEYRDPQADICAFLPMPDCPVLVEMTEPLASGISIFPNPFSEFLTVSFSREVSPSTNIHLFDILGNTIEIRSQKTDNTFHLECSNIPQGIYFLKIDNEEKSKRPQIFKVLAD